MTIINILNSIHHAIKIAYQIDYKESSDTLTFTYTVGANRYTMNFTGVTDIKTRKQLDALIQVIQSNIAYHEKEQEQEKE